MIREELIFVATCDISGLVRGKGFPARELPLRLKKGVGWTGSNLMMSPFGPIWDTPFGTAGDFMIVPDPAVEVRVDFADGSAIEHFFLGDICNTDGSTWECCPRDFLRRAVQQLEELASLRMIAAFEHPPRNPVERARCFERRCARWRLRDQSHPREPHDAPAHHERQRQRAGHAILDPERLLGLGVSGMGHESLGDVDEVADACAMLWRQMTIPDRAVFNAPIVSSWLGIIDGFRRARRRFPGTQAKPQETGAKAGQQSEHGKRHQQLQQCKAP